VSSLREICQDLGLAIHAHRAFHGAFTRVHDHGFSMLNLAKSVRLLGVDNLHIGTANIGKLVGTAEEVRNIQNNMTRDNAPADQKEHSLEQNWYGMKPVFPCSSGGLHPILVEDVLNKMGTNIMLQIGGGVHGHPKGSYAGAKAMREAVEAYMDGVHVDDAAKTSKELRQALEYWGHTRPR
ncbi:ribulose-bisphosphate carboxylase large subunit, partial [Candidatus Woesearchaeota archaeon]|nr:ribulose-bisphosphate carboxylase large subunit [Candidatus Woesearchaeota archaeon]